MPIHSSLTPKATQQNHVSTRHCLSFPACTTAPRHRALLFSPVYSDTACVSPRHNYLRSNARNSSLPALTHSKNDLHIQHQPVVTKGKHKRKECHSQTSASRGLVAQGSNLCRQVLPPGPQRHASASWSSCVP
ncbi:hypothetical protein ACOMHN_013080 [Nucella lapillus]